jgi:O-antigen ligase
MIHSAESGSAPQSLVLDGGNRSRSTAISRSETFAGLALCSLVFLEHIAFGGGRREVALGFTALYGLLLAGLALFAPWAHRLMDQARTLRAPALLFGLLILLALWSMTPWAPGGPHPVWSYVSAPPATALDRSAVFLELVKLAGLASVFSVGWLLGGQDDRARFVFEALVIANGAYSVWAFFNQMIDPAFLFGVIPMPNSGTRLEASFLSANTAGTFFGVSVVLATCAVMERLRGAIRLSLQKSIERVTIPIVAGMFAAVCLILTASRGAMAAAVVGLVVLLVWEGVARRWRLFGPVGAGLFALVLGAAALLAIGGAPLVARLLEGGGEINRHDIVEAHWNAFIAAPWLGYGLGGFDGVNELVMTSANYISLWNVHAAHNVYLQWLEEGGVLGAGAMFATILSVLMIIIAGAFRRVRMTGWLRGVVAISLVFLVHGLSDFALQIPSMATLWAALLGLGAGLACPRRARS